MSDTKFDPTKPAQTRDGRKARILCTDAKGNRPIVALVEYRDGTGEASDEWYIDGRAILQGESGNDLINVEPRVVEYANVYEQIGCGVWWNNVGATRDFRVGHNKFVCTLKRTREGSRVISVEVVDFAKEVQR